MAPAVLDAITRQISVVATAMRDLPARTIRPGRRGTPRFARARAAIAARRLATPAAVALLLVGMVAGIALWLWLTREDTAAERAALVPVVRVTVDGAPGAPGSGTQEGADAAADRDVMAVAGDAEPAPSSAPMTMTMAPAPAPGLSEPSAFGPLPTVGPDGSRPWQVYARPDPTPPGRPRIAVVIAELGLSGATTEIALDTLPPEVSLAFAPAGARLQSWLEAARERGHEVMLGVPMEPVGYPMSDPGPNTLFRALAPERNIERLSKTLGRAVGYVGITSLSGSAFTADTNAMRPILTTLKDRGLMMLDAAVAGSRALRRLAEDLGVAFVRADLRVDRNQGRGAIDDQLARLEELARETGGAIGLGTPYPTTLERVSRWLRLLPDRGIAVVPVSAMVGRPGDS